MSYNPHYGPTAHWHIPQPPTWDATMKAIHVDPDEPLEMWRAYANLHFLDIDINRPRG